MHPSVLRRDGRRREESSHPDEAHHPPRGGADEEEEGRDSERSDQHHSFVICCIIYLYLYTGIVLAIAIYSSKNYQGFTVLMFVEDDMFLFIRCGGRQWLCDIIVCTDY